MRTLGVAFLVLSACGGQSASSPATGGNGSGGATGEGGEGGAGNCGTSITFRVSRAQAAPPYCPGRSTGCAIDWLSITSASGEIVQRDDYCRVPCSSCESLGCPAICFIAAPILESQQQTWDGTEFTADTCGSGIGCLRPICAPAGRYVAEICGYPQPEGAGTSCSTEPSAAAECVQIPFDVPGSAVLEAVLGGP
jgi:hypothetical protein